MKRFWLSFWEARSQTDRRILSVLGAIALGSLFFAYVWLPVSQERTRLRATLPELRGTAAQMAALGAEAATLKARLASGGASRSAQDAVEQTMQAAGIKATRMAASGNDRVQITFDTIAFDDWMRFLKALHAEPYMRLESTRIVVLESAGAVRVQAVISADAKNRPGAPAAGAPPPRS